MHTHAYTHWIRKRGLLPVITVLREKVLTMWCIHVLLSKWVFSVPVEWMYPVQELAYLKRKTLKMHLKCLRMLFWIRYVWPGGLLSLSNQWFCLLQLDQLVVDAAKEKRDMEQKHSTIQQKVHSHSVSRFPSTLRFKHKYRKPKNNIQFLVLDIQITIQHNELCICEWKPFFHYLKNTEM